MRRIANCLMWLLLALMLVLLFWLDGMAAEASIQTQDTRQPTPTPTLFPTPTSLPPTIRIIGPDVVETWRIEDGWNCGGSAHHCMWSEDDALVLARVAIGESPSSPDDQIFIMWLIRLRTELWFKNAGSHSGWNNDPARWGPPTSIKREALCDGGCQFSPVRAADGIYFGCLLSPYHGLRKMLCPLDEDLPDFGFAVAAARYVLDAPMSEFPVEMRGYDNFRSPSITGEGQCNRDPCGLRSRQFFPRANIWRDEFTDDNEFWKRSDDQITYPPRPAGPIP